jgi:membrane-associated phospholipid phosphatase
MESIWETQIPLIQSIQQVEWLTSLMRVVTLLGEETFFLMAVPLLYWCVHAQLGVRVGLILLLSTSVNSAFKLVMAMPRPYWYSPQIQPLVAEASFGLPSAHAQNAVTVWGGVGAYARRGWAWTVVISILLLIGLSRVSLGVHFITDVLAGWAIGALVLWAFLSWFDPVRAWIERQTLQQQIALTMLSSLLLLAPSVLVLATSTGQVPADWMQNAARAFPDAEPLQPHTLDTPISSAGTWFGFGVGAAWFQATSRLSVAGPVWQRVTRYLVGMVVVVALWAGLGALFPRDATFLAYALRFLRYAIIGAWIGGGAPASFQRVGLTSAASTTTNEI